MSALYQIGPEPNGLDVSYERLLIIDELTLKIISKVSSIIDNVGLHD